MKQFALTVALMLSTTMMWAADEVVIIKKLNGTANSSAGTVTSAVSNGKCTLTVTPADGNYITVDFITAERLVSGNMAQAPRRRIGMDNMLTVSAVSSSDDPSGETKYTFDMPGADYYVEVIADFQSRTSISDADITLAQTTFTYDGKAKTPDIQSVVVGGKSLTSDDYSIEYSDNINAGTATVTLTGQRTYTGIATAEFTISKATITPTVTIEGWSYGSTPSTPVVTGNSGNGDVTITYAAKGTTTFSESVPTAVGDYIVKATIAETANYEGTEVTAEFSISASAAVITKLPAAVTNLTYTGESQALITAGEATGGELQYKLGADGTYGTTIPSAINAGTYTVYYKVVGDANHTGVAEASIEATIGKATITPTVTIEGWSYGSTPSTPVVTGNSGNGDVTITYASKGTTTFSESVPTAVGDYIVKATIAETANYEGAEVTAEFSISASSAVITKLPAAVTNLTYTGESQALITGGEATGGELQYKLGTDGTYGTTIPSAINAGSYTVYYKVVGDANHTGVAESSIEATIGKATITPTVTIEGWSYGSTPSTPVVTGNSGNGDVTITYASKGTTTFSESVPTAVGDYIVKATISETANYAGTEVTAEFSISASAAVITKLPAAIDGLTYTGESQSLITAGEATGGELQYKLGADGTYGTTIPSAINAGTYTVYYKVVGDANHTGVAEASIEATIGKATITPTVTIEGWSYGSTPSTPVVTGNSGNGDVTITYASKGTTTFSESVPTAVGDYIVKATIAETANYAGAEVTAEFSISASSAVITKLPAAVTNLTYTGESQSLITAGEATGGELQYKLGTDGTYGTTIPSAINAGTYTVYYKVVGDANHTGVAESSIEATIGKATITPTVTIEGWSYGSTPSTPVVTGNSGNGDVTITYAAKGTTTFSESVPTAVGDYIVKATIAETANYEGAEVTAEFSISASSAVITKLPAAIDGLTYTGESQSLITAGEATGGELQYKLGTDGTYGTTIPSAINAGTYTVYYKVVGDANHTGVAESSIEATIGKATITPTVTIEGWSYGSTPSTPVVTGNSGNGDVTITYASKGTTTFSESVPTAVGDYIVKATIAATDNYEGAEVTAEFKISASAAVITKLPAAIDGLTYTGESQSLITAGEASGGELQYKLGTDGTYSTTIPSAINAGTYTVYYKVVGDANHTGVAEASLDVTIAKAKLTPTVTIEGWSYGSTPSTPVVTGNSGNGDVTITYAAKGSSTFSESVPTAVGDYIVKATIAETANYEGAEVTAEFSISASAAVITKLPAAVTNLTYTGESQSLITAGEATGGELQYKLGADGTYGTTIPSAINAGSYTVYYKVVGDENHTGVAESSLDVTIAKAKLTPTVTIEGWSYGSTPSTPVVTGNSGNGDVTITYASKGTTTFSESVPTAVGDYIVKATIAETANYEGTEVTAEFSISASAAVITKLPAAIDGLTYTGESQSLITGGDATGGELQYKLGTDGTYGTTIPSAINAGTYTVYYKVVGDANHTGVAESSIEATIGKATITPTVTLQGWDYGDEPNIPVVEGNLGNGSVTFTYATQGSNQFSTEIPTVAGNYIVKATIAETENYQGGEATTEFTIETVWLIVNGIKVTEQNRRDILNDNGSVKFNGINQLILEKAEINGDIRSYIDKLVIYLKGDNYINGIIIGKQAELVFTTEGNEPGNLTIKTETENRVITGFELISFEQNLTILSGSYDAKEAVIGTPVKPIADEEDPENIVNLGDTGDEDDLSNTIINDVLYTLDADNDDGVNPEENSVVLGSSMADEDIDDVINNYTPGTEEFAEHFAGVTFMIPAGTGKVLVTAKTGEEGIMHVKIGSQTPYVITGVLEYTDFEIPYACAQATYVYIYNASPATETAEAKDNRAGKKTTVTIGLSSVGVSASGMQSSNSEGNVDGETNVLTDDDVTYDLEEGTLIATNSEVTTIDDEAFVSFPFLKYIDLRNTQITGIHVSREEGPFKGVSKNTFIYLPTGNTTDEANVIIGNICEYVLLDGDMNEEESFGLSGSFTTGSIDFDRTFNKDEVSTLYLPFPISAADKDFFGTFYTVEKIVNGQVIVKKVEGDIQAHTPYLFKAAADGTQLYNLDVIEMSMPEGSAAAVSHRAESSAQLIGCYEFFYGEGETQVFIFAPNDDPEKITFERIHTEDFIKPFQAYLFTDAEGTTLGVTDKEEASGIVSVGCGIIATDRVYDLQGRKLVNGHWPKAKGIYIINGQKTVIR